MSQYSGQVHPGQQLGRTISYPTANLDPSILADQQLEPGVYAAQVQVAGQNYTGALYFGPRLVLNEHQNVLEIHILDFDQDIYGQTISFTLGQFVRGVKQLNSLAELQQQLHQDIDTIRQLAMIS